METALTIVFWNMKQAEMVDHKLQTQETLEHYKFTVQQCKRE